MGTKAKFYVATSSGWVEANFGSSGDGSFYGTCDTAANIAAKVVSGVKDFVLTTGVSINIKFTYSNTATAPTLNVNNNGAKNIYYNGSISNIMWSAGSIVNLVYDDSKWIINGLGATIDTAITNSEIDAILAS